LPVRFAKLKQILIRLPLSMRRNRAQRVPIHQYPN
jgi:hypothetical protein